MSSPTARVRRSKRPYGPPEPNPIIVANRERIDLADDPVEVVIGALGLRDARSFPTPMGGGFAIATRARPYAEDIVLALKLRGMIEAG